MKFLTLTLTLLLLSAVNAADDKKKEAEAEKPQQFKVGCFFGGGIMGYLLREGGYKLRWKKEKINLCIYALEAKKKK